MPDSECLALLSTYNAFKGWQNRSILATNGQHGYHEPPWTDVVAWMARVVARASQHARAR